MKFHKNTYRNDLIWEKLSKIMKIVWNVEIVEIVGVFGK